MMLVAWAWAQEPPTFTPEGMAQLARATSLAPEAATLVREHRAEAVAWPGTPSFVVERVERRDAPWLVSLHGHGSTAFEDMKVWLPHAESRGFNVLSLQWWMGPGESDGDYLSATQLYGAVDAALSIRGARPGTVALHGFSRGSAAVYLLAATDAIQKKWFGTVIANAGGALPEAPAIRAVDSAAFGTTPYQGQRWVLFCGGKDPEPEVSGCPAMRKTLRWVRKKGASARLIADLRAEHGGMHMIPDNAAKAIEGWAAQAPADVARPPAP